MKVSFKESLSAAKEKTSGTFVFIGKDYNFPAASIFSRFLNRKTGKPVEFFNAPCETSPEVISLFATQDDPNLDEFLNKDVGTFRVVPLQENSYTTKAKWSRLMDNCVVVEVRPPTPNTLKEDVEFACSLMGVQYDTEGVSSAVSHNIGGWSGIWSDIEAAEKSSGSLKGYSSVLPKGVQEDVSYMEFKDSFLFKLPRETADVFLRTDRCLEYTRRLVDDMATYFAVWVCDAEGKTSREISQAFNINEWFLRNRLVPRLRTMGAPRILKCIEKLSAILDSVMKGESVDGQAQISATVLLLLC